MKTLLLVLLLLGFARHSEAAELEAAISAAIEATESRVVQLRYFGDGGDSLGASAAPVTGYDLGGGWVITSLYGLGEDPAAILARRDDGSQQSLKLTGRDMVRRLALLRTEEANPRELTIAEVRPARVGETVLTLGRVFSDTEVNLTVGIVSAVNRLGGRAIQTDAAASPANYGGPLVALDGSLLGIITPLSPPGQSGIGLYDSGVGFAVPPSGIAQSLPHMAVGKTIEPGWLGIQVGEGDPLRSPAKVLKVTTDGPAAAAGIQVGETIEAIDAKPTATIWALRAALSGFDAGSSVEVELAASPDQPSRTVRVTLVVRPESAEESNASESIEAKLDPPALPKQKPGEP